VVSPEYGERGIGHSSARDRPMDRKVRIEPNAIGLDLVAH